MSDRLPREFYCRDVLSVAPELLGKKLVRKLSGKPSESFIISETEAYRGTEDLACHARRGMTARNMIMFGQGGFLYMYLIYGIHWMMNVVTGEKGNPPGPAENVFKTRANQRPQGRFRNGHT